MKVLNATVEAMMNDLREQEALGNLVPDGIYSRSYLVRKFMDSGYMEANGLSALTKREAELVASMAISLKAGDYTQYVGTIKEDWQADFMERTKMVFDWNGVMSAADTYRKVMQVMDGGNFEGCMKEIESHTLAPSPIVVDRDYLVANLQGFNALSSYDEERLSEEEANLIVDAAYWLARSGALGEECIHGPQRTYAVVVEHWNKSKETVHNIK